MFNLFNCVPTCCGVTVLFSFSLPLHVEFYIMHKFLRIKRKKFLFFGDIVLGLGFINVNKLLEVVTGGTVKKLFYAY